MPNKKTKYYSRSVYKREPINRFGKLGFVLHTLFVKTNNINPLQKGLRIKFYETNEKKFAIHAKPGQIVDTVDGKKVW